jgi:hypothetical protein
MSQSRSRNGEHQRVESYGGGSRGVATAVETSGVQLEGT